MLDEALKYFRGDTGYRRLFSLFKQKYESLGRIGGTVKIEHFTEDEHITVARFYATTVSDLKQKGKVSLESFEQKLHSTRFAGISLKELLEAYFKEPLVSNMERKRLKDHKQEQFFTQLESNFPRLTFWIDYLKNKTRDTYWIYRLMEESPESFKDKVYHLDSAFNLLPASLERLPMFSQRITRNPHAFDLNRNLGKLLIHLLSVDHYHSDSIVIPTDSEGVNELLLTYGILRDDITNYVTCANLLAETEDGSHLMWEAAASTHSVLNAPLRELVDLTRIYPSGEQKVIWVVENSGVYSSILDKIPKAPLICTQGQFKLAALLLIDLLVKEGCVLYYAGDLDPEGLSMAERLLQRHSGHICLWKMDVASYRKSEADIVLSVERLNKLDSITIPELVPVVKELRKRKRAGYQEALVDEMVGEIRESIKINR
ncbi:TIGR02679 family protein [Radiobacillus kanasensis]|uniref:TIGR02679 family protein n=1 Tax=Radiobacillus kanasensis TaxID=2844358 RepID=UPI001E334797|nr:TIGR02679 family protein [Radiobacillus kanasensis]UFU00260.1 TIGR02679 family protein [Radiobacillus kanasensis]